MVDGLILVGVRRLVDRIELDQIGLRFETCSILTPPYGAFRATGYTMWPVA